MHPFCFPCVVGWMVGWLIGWLVGGLFVAMCACLLSGMLRDTFGDCVVPVLHSGDPGTPL